jgi:hypothetical protein
VFAIFAPYFLRDDGSRHGAIEETGVRMIPFCTGIRPASFRLPRIRHGGSSSLINAVGLKTYQHDSKAENWVRFAKSLSMDK